MKKSFALFLLFLFHRKLVEHTHTHTLIEIRRTHSPCGVERKVRHTREESIVWTTRKRKENSNRHGDSHSDDRFSIDLNLIFNIILQIRNGLIYHATRLPMIWCSLIWSQLNHECMQPIKLWYIRDMQTELGHFNNHHTEKKIFKININSHFTFISRTHRQFQFSSFRDLSWRARSSISYYLPSLEITHK